MVNMAVGVVMIGAVILAGAVFYYLRPSTGSHANPNGAAITVASLRAHAAEPEHHSGQISWPGSRGLLSGYDTPTAVIVPDPPDISERRMLAAA